MLLAFAVLPDSPEGRPELCLIPDKPDVNARFLRVDVMGPNPSAVYYVGPSEACNVEPESEPNTIIIRPVPPNVILLTPDFGGQPGQKAFKVKIVKLSHGGYQTFYARDNLDPWRPWIPNKVASTAGV